MCLTGVKTQTYDDTRRVGSMRGGELRIAFPTNLIAFKSGSCSSILADTLNERMFLGHRFGTLLVNGSAGQGLIYDQLGLILQATATKDPMLPLINITLD